MEWMKGQGNNSINELTETEEMTLKHVFGLNHMLIEEFEALNLDFETREFLIFQMMFAIHNKKKQ